MEKKHGGREPFLEKPKRRELQGDEITIPYSGRPIEIFFGAHRLRVGKPRDLGIEEDPQPDTFNVIDDVRLSETNGVEGRKRLKDGKGILLGNVATHGFRFGSDVAKLQLGIKINGDDVTIRDLSRKRTLVRF